jgi:hypothetical protein
MGKAGNFPCERGARKLFPEKFSPRHRAALASERDAAFRGGMSKERYIAANRSITRDVMATACIPPPKATKSRPMP